MPKKKNRNTVNAPFITFQPEKMPNLEKYKFFQISRKIGGHFSQFVIFIGVLLCLVSSVYMLTSTQFSIHNPLLLDAMVLLGVVNVLCGLLLLVTE